jgi:hypothetical protein
MPTGHQPLITKEMLITYMREVCDILTPIVEVNGIYPSSDDIVPFGVYVRDCHPINREVYQLGTQSCGAIYTVTDQFEILYVSFQDDPQSLVVLGHINDLAANAKFFDGYFEITFSKTEVIGNRSEKHTYTFNLKRLDFMDSH